MNRSFKFLILQGFVLVIGVLVLAACGGGDTTPTPEEAEAEPTIVAEAEGEVITLYVGPNTVDCVGVAPQQCLLVKENPDDEYTLFYGQIEGFEFEPGYEYELRVTRTRIEDPPADASALQYSLVEVVSKTAVAAEPTIALEGPLWQLEAYLNEEGMLVSVLPDSQVTALFQDGQVTGTAGCNSYFAPYTLDGNNLAIGLGGMTQMFCQPEALMTQEAEYMAQLSAVASYRISDSELQLSDANGELLLVYQSVEPTALIETLWVATGYNNGRGGVVSVLGGTEITAVFSEDGTVSGAAGCNNYTATYQVDGNAINIGPAATTRKMCAEPEGIMDQEAAYVAALETAATWTIMGDDLELRTADGALVASYTAQEETAALEPAAPEGAAQELQDELGNLEYQSEFTQSGTAPLVDGEYREPAAPDSAMETVVTLIPEYTAAGELNGVPSVAVILASNSGGSGVFVDLAVVQEQDGQLVNVATILLGDRVDINSVEISDNQIRVDLVTQGPDDPMCCPTQQEIRTYELQEDELVLVSTEVVSAPAGEEEAQPAMDLVGPTWQWIETASGDGAVLTVPNPEQYTIEFLPDGMVAIQADCNRAAGSYEVDGASLSITLGPATLAACAPDSLSDTFLQQLGASGTYVMADGNLIINLFADAGNMTFVPAEQAEAAQPPAEPTATTEPAAETPDITGIVWEWQEFTDPVNGVTPIARPERYSMDLLPSGAVRILADCNRGGGSYTIDGSSIDIEIKRLTRAACPPGSLSDQFVQYLNDAVIYFVEGSNLFLDLPVDTGTMKFGQ